MWRVLVPLRYLLIDHPEKWKFDLLLPACFALVFCLPLLSAEFRAGAVDSFDVLGKISNFLGVLVGFFIAALAAVATFGKREMDDPMPGEVRLEHRVNAETYFEELSRRRFLSFLFGYLAFSALALFLVSYIYLVADRYFFVGSLKCWREYVFSGFWIVFMFALSNLLSNTLLGLFYLTDRIHRANKTAEWGNGNSGDK